MIVESYKGFDIYWEFIEGANGFADSEVYTSSASVYGRKSVETVRKDIDKMFIL